MDGRYCSRCLKTFLAPGPEQCPRATCRRPRPSTDWPAFLPRGGQVDERYHVERILGAGGAGVTYRCFDDIEQEDVALKILHSDRGRGTLANRLAIEGEVLELLDHPYIVPFRALKLVGAGPYYLATLHMPGGSLEGWVRRWGALRPLGVLCLGRQLGLALDFVHAGGIVHRDLKPANVLLEVADSERPIVRLADFGIARVFRDVPPLPGLTRTGAFIGTPEYAAPEQVRGEKGIGPAADAFALGALLHYAASGKALHSREDIGDWAAFRERSWEQDDRPRLVGLCTAEDPDDEAALALLDELIDALMHPDPQHRLDVATAALRMGATPAELAPPDRPRLAPATLTASAEVEVHVDSIEAIVPVEPFLGSEAPSWEAGPGLLQISPQHASSSDRDEDEDEAVGWPPPGRARARRRFGLVAAAALLGGLAVAWAGGPAALLGTERIGSIEEAVASAFDDLLGSQVAIQTSPSKRPRAPAERSPRSTTRGEKDPSAPPAAARVAVEAAPGRAPSSQQLPAAGESRASKKEPAVARSSASEPDPLVVDSPDASSPELEAPEAGDESPGLAVELSVDPKSGRGRIELDARIPLPGSRDSSESSPEPRSEEGEPSAVDAWASDSEDTRSIHEVLAEAEEESRRVWRAELRRQVLEADARAAAYAEDAAVLDVQNSRLQSRWDAVKDETLTEANAAEHEAVEKDGAASWGSSVEDGDVGALEELLGRSPRIDPR